MNVSNEKAVEAHIRKSLESCYDRGSLKEAIILGNILDKMQCMLLLTEEVKIAS